MPNYSKIAGSLSELLAKLPKGSTAAQEAIRLEMELEAARQAALYAPHTLPTETGAAALEQAKKTLGKAQGGPISLDKLLENAMQVNARKMATGGKTRAGTAAKPFPWEDALEAQLQRTKKRLTGLATDPEQEGVNIVRQYLHDPTLSPEENEQKLEDFMSGFVGSTTGKIGNVKVKSTVKDPERMAFPGIYQRPDVIAAEAASRVAEESPNLQKVFGVTREDLFQMGKGRQGNLPGNLPGAAAKPKGSAAAAKVMGSKNVQRIIDTMAEAEKHPRLVQGMDPWYVMDPVYQRMEQLLGKEKAIEEYRKLNTLMGMASPGSEVLTEIPRGTAAYYLQKQGRFPEFMEHAGKPAGARRSGFPVDIMNVPGHAYHKTAQALPMQQFLGSGEMQMSSPKVPMYIEASGVPQTGFQTRTPVGDAHWSRAVGLADTRGAATRKGQPIIPGASVTNPEMSLLGPWWREEVAAPMGLESVPAQARAWGTFSGQTGVTTPIGAPKIELLSDKIAETAYRLGVSIDKARDLVLMGETYAGKKDGGVIRMAEGGVPEKRDVSQLFPINPNIGREPVARTRAGVPVQDTNVLGGALQGLGETLLGAGRGYTATALGGIQDLLNMVDIPQLMTGESYQIPYGSEYFKEKLPLKPTTQTGEVAQELGSFLPLDPTQVVKSGYKAAKTVGKAIAPTAAEMALDLAEKGGVPVRQFAVPPEGKLSKEEYSRMMREKYAAENAAKQAKKEAAPVTMADLKPKEEKVPADKLGFYSPAEKAAANLKRNIADGELMLSDLKKFPDVTPDELAMTGLEEWLKGKKTVTKQQVKDYMAKNKLELEEVKYEQGTGNADDMRFGSGEVIDDHDYISSRADDIVYDWDYIGHESKDDIRARILEDADPEEAEQLLASGKIDDLVENEVRNLAEEQATSEYYDNPYRRYRNDMGYEIVGNDDVGYHVTDPQGNHVRMNREAYDVETAEGHARQDAMDNGYLDEGETKYHDYQLPGGENYREILLKTPSKKQHLEEAIRELEHSMENPGNDPRELREMQKELDKLKFDYKYAEKNAYEGSHWDEPNVIAHMRLQDRVDSEGNKILYVDEMQSDWHQEGRRTGYKTKEDSELIAKVKEKRDEASDKTNDIWNQRVQRSRELAKEFADSQDPAVKALGSTKYMENDKILNDLDNAYNEASKVLSALNKELSKYTSKVPKGPFSDNWHKLALKRVMKYAADNGYTRVGFSKAQPQVNRWGTDVVAWDKNPAGGWVVTATEQRGGRAGNINLEDDARARGILQESKVNTINNRDQLYATVAKISRGKTEEELQKLTDRIWKQMQEKDAGIVAPREAGMKKFYDEELEAALKKYANQFKGKYGQTTLDVPREGKQTINYIDITPDLKKSTTKGQPYKVGGAVRMANGGPVNLDNLLAQAIENAQPKSLDHLLHQALVKSYAEGGAAYNTTPDMADGGQFIQGEAF